MPQLFGDFEDRLGTWIEYDLYQAFPVAQIDEYDPAVIAPPVHPAGHRDLLAQKRFVNLSAVM
jgi:hypothetical protein